MALSNNPNDFIGSLIQTGSDAMQNLYFIQFSGSVVDDYAERLKVRVQDFQAPTFTQGKEPKNYLTVSVDMPTAFITGDKNLQFTFRVDSNYKIYELLLRQQSSTMEANSGWAINQVPNFNDSDSGLTLHVYAFDRTLGNDPNNEENYSEIYNFKYCWIKSIEGLTYSYDNNSPLTVSVSIGFMDFEDPQNLLIK